MGGRPRKPPSGGEKARGFGRGTRRWRLYVALSASFTPCRRAISRSTRPRERCSVRDVQLSRVRGVSYEVESGTGSPVPAGSEVPPARNGPARGAPTGHPTGRPSGIRASRPPPHPARDVSTQPLDTDPPRTLSPRRGEVCRLVQLTRLVIDEQLVRVQVIAGRRTAPGSDRPPEPPVPQ